MNFTGEKAGQISIRVGILIIAVGVIAGSIAYSAAPSKTTFEDVRNYLGTASENEIRELLATISGDLLNEIAQEKFPLTVVDDLGRGVIISNPPQRIVSTAPTVTEILFALDLDNRVVGVTNYCNYPPRLDNLKENGNLDVIGSFSNPSEEKILSQEPDLVLSTAGIQEEYVYRFEEVGLTVVALEGDNLLDIIQDIRTVGRITGVSSRAEKLTENMENIIQYVTDRTENLTEEERPRVFWETWHDPLMTAGKGTFVNELIERAGGQNIFGDLEQDYPVISKETIIEKNPEVYLQSGHSRETLENIEQIPGFGGLKAVEDNRVYRATSDIYTRAGPRIADALMEMAYYLHPDLFEKPTFEHA